MRATKAVIHLDNLFYNIQSIQKHCKSGLRLCVPVKADGYGHGATRVAFTAIKAGASFLAVASVQEGVDLRLAGIVSPILSLSLPTPEEIPSIIVHSITPLVFDKDFIHQLGQDAKKMNRVIPVHLKIDSGMGRIGCFLKDAVEVAKTIAEEPNLTLEGTCTHFAVSDSSLPEDVAFTKKQIADFSAAVEAIRQAGINPGIVHAASSGAVLQYPQAHFDMIRPGILIYGYAPSRELASVIDLKPVMELETQVVAIRKVPKGTSISYGRTWIAQKDTYIATLPIGYADGLVRRLSPGIKVLINDELYPIVGRICMDQCMVDIGENPTVKRWDKVTVFGPNNRGASAWDLAEQLDTITYEITCGVNKRVPRVYLSDPEI